MGSILLFTLNSIMPVILLILTGYILKTKGFFTDGFLAIGNKTVFYVCLPVLLFKNIADIEDISEIRLDVVAYSLGIIFLLCFIGFLFTFLIKDPKQKGVIHQCIFRSNFALIGVPLAELMGGDSGVKMAAILSLFSIPVFNIMGVIVLSVYKGGSKKPDVKKIVRDIFTNPLILGILAGLVCALIKIAMKNNGIVNPLEKVEFLNTSIAYIARSATPLALLVLGGRFDLKSVGGLRKQLILGVTGRNVIAPLTGVGIAAALNFAGIANFGPDVFAAVIALFSTPVAVSSAIMAEAMDNDGQLAGQLVVWTSILSLFSLFIVIFICRALGLL